jgi:hypothetical protein
MGKRYYWDIQNSSWFSQNGTIISDEFSLLLNAQGECWYKSNIQNSALNGISGQLPAPVVLSSEKEPPVFNSVWGRVGSTAGMDTLGLVPLMGINPLAIQATAQSVQ